MHTVNQSMIGSFLWLGPSFGIGHSSPLLNHTFILKLLEICNCCFYNVDVLFHYSTLDQFILCFNVLYKWTLLLLKHMFSCLIFRVISRAPGLKLVVETLMSSLKPIGNIVVICCAFFIIFGILGVQVSTKNNKKT